MRSRRQAIDAAEAARFSARIAERVIALEEFKAARHILCYSALSEEVQTRGLLTLIRASGKVLYLPVVRPSCHMDAVRVDEDTPLTPDRLGVSSPTGGEPFPPGQLDLVIAPGIAFDPLGTRLGFGKGHFDRFLVDCRCPVVGLCYEVQLTPVIERHTHDIPMDKIVTEARVIDCAAARREKGVE